MLVTTIIKQEHTFHSLQQLLCHVWQFEKKIIRRQAAHYSAPKCFLWHMASLLYVKKKADGNFTIGRDPMKNIICISIFALNKWQPAVIGKHH